MGLVGLFFAVWCGYWLPLALPLSAWLSWSPFQTATLRQKLPLLLTLYAAAPLALLTTEAIADRKIIYGLNQPDVLISAGLGFLVGLCGLALLFWAQLKLAWLRRGEDLIGVRRVVEAVFLGTILAVGVGLVEEMIFRVFLISQLARSLSFGLAAAISSSIFALLHLVWDWQNTKFQLPGLWIMGMVLAFAYRVNGFSIGLPWGLHAGWILGMALAEMQGTLTPTAQVPIWVTGQAGQPLAGVGALLFLLGTAGLLWITPWQLIL
ncbi:MAG: lysostaphin resistance A-like protein [Elainellaceae cyanobacterium]